MINYEFQNTEFSFQAPLISKLLWKQTQEVYESMKLENDMNRAKDMPSRRHSQFKL